MTVSLLQAIILGLFCGIAKSGVAYTACPGFMMNTVIFNAVIIGGVMGDMKSAMIIGASLQLIYLGVISAGGNQPSDPCLAAYIAIPVAMSSGLNVAAASALAVPIGLLGPQITNLVYLIAGFFAQKGDKFVEEGNAGAMTRWTVVYMGIIRMLAFAIPVTIGLYFGSGALQGVLDNIPKFVTNGLTAMGHALPAVGFAIITSLISKPKYMPFFFAGFFFIQYTKVGTIPLLLLGLFLTFLYITFTFKEYTNASDEDDFDDFDDDEDEEEVVTGVVQRLLSKKDVFKSWCIWWLVAEVGHSFERMQAPMFCTAMTPALKKFYKDDKENYIDALKRHMTFFNAEAHWGGGPILGLSLAMEEKRSQDPEAIPGEMIMDIKTGLMGPLSGLGDTISWSTLMYLFIGLFLPLAQKGNPLGGIGPFVCMIIYGFAVGYFLTSKCYTYGYSFAENMLKSGLINVIIAAASILGLFMMGGLASTYVTVSTPIAFTTGTYSTTLQSIFDSILPGILPLGVVCCVWGYLTKIKRNYFIATIGLTVISLVAGFLGILI